MTVVPEGVSYTILEIHKIPMVLDHEVSGVEVEVALMEDMPESLLL